MPTQKELVIARAGGCCEYCLSQLHFSPDPFSVEHILPVAKGGSEDLNNLALSCQGCNNHKYTHTSAIDPVSGQRALLYHPRHDRWSDHFAWIDNCEHLIGLTPTGRATVIQLQLNRTGVVNLRQALYTLGRHPPDRTDIERLGSE
ncbi:MAG: HNH endonuclease signature motif containing protein [Caldilineaceae bacterium]